MRVMMVFLGIGGGYKMGGRELRLFQARCRTQERAWRVGRHAWEKKIHSRAYQLITAIIEL